MSMKSDTGTGHPAWGICAWVFFWLAEVAATASPIALAASEWDRLSVCPTGVVALITSSTQGLILLPCVVGCRHYQSSCLPVPRALCFAYIILCSVQSSVLVGGEDLCGEGATGGAFYGYLTIQQYFMCMVLGWALASRAYVSRMALAIGPTLAPGLQHALFDEL